jgi:hypothetical protein
MASVIAFDVNETLLDLRALDAPFEALLGGAATVMMIAFSGRPGRWPRRHGGVSATESCSREVMASLW